MKIVSLKNTVMTASFLIALVYCVTQIMTYQPSPVPA